MVGALNVPNLRDLQYRSECSVYELWLEVFRVRVGVHYKISRGDREGPPHGIAFAVGRAVGGHQLVLGVDFGAPAGGDLCRTVFRVCVYNQDLVHQSGFFVYRTNLIQDAADRVRYVPARQHKADRQAPFSLAAD